MTSCCPDETELVARARRGDGEAFATLIGHYASSVLTVAWRIVGDRSLAEDAAQEAFLAAFRALPGFRAEARFSTWLYRIVVNKCRDLQRARSARREISEHEATEDGGPAPEPAGESAQHRTPEALLLDQQRAQTVWQAIRALPPLYREAFVLRHVEGLSYEEMSDILAVDGSTLRMRVYKARQELSRQLAALVAK